MENKEEQPQYEPGYPIWRYHKTQLPEGKIVFSKAQDEALGSGWVHSPLEFDAAPKAEPCPVELVKPVSKSKKAKASV